MANTKRTSTKRSSSKRTGTRRASAKRGSARQQTVIPEDVFGLGEMGKRLRKLKVPGIDVTAILESQRKDMQALADANREAFEGIKALARRRNEMLQESLAKWQAAMAGATGTGALRHQAEVAREGIEDALVHFRELAEMEAATRRKTWGILQDRFQENLNNLQKLLQPK